MKTVLSRRQCVHEPALRRDLARNVAAGPISGRSLDETRTNVVVRRNTVTFPGSVAQKLTGRSCSEARQTDTAMAAAARVPSVKTVHHRLTPGRQASSEDIQAASGRLSDGAAPPTPVRRRSKVRAAGFCTVIRAGGLPTLHLFSLTAIGAAALAA